MAEGFIIRKAGGGATTEAPTINVTEETNILKFTLTNNDDNTAIVSYKIDNVFGAVELTSGATSSEITIDTLPDGTYTLEAYATVVGEVVTSDTIGVTLTLATYELIADLNTSGTNMQIDITGLNINKNDEYILNTSFLVAGGTARLYINDNLTDTNYISQILAGSGTNFVVTRIDDPRLLSSDRSFGKANIKLTENGYVFWESKNSQQNGTASNDLRVRNWNVLSKFTVSSITKLSIICDNTNVGNLYVKLYKINKGVA